MSIYDASLDYRSAASPRPAETHAPEETENYLNEIVSLEEETLSEGLYSDRRSRRMRFLGFVLVNTLFWPVVVYVGLQISASHSPQIVQDLMKTSGVQTMTAEQLIATVTSQGRPVFWLNRMTGDMYSDNTSVNGIDVISYLPSNANPGYLNQLDLVVKTYRDSNLYNMQLHPLAGGSGTVVENVGNVSVTYSPASPDHSIIAFTDRPQIVTIDYPSFKKVSTLVMDAQNLEPIQ